jgi:hypothetical protein
MAQAKMNPGAESDMPVQPSLKIKLFRMAGFAGIGALASQASRKTAAAV